MSIYEVVLSKKALKDLKKIPQHVSNKLLVWIDLVAEEGIYKARKIPAYHDESLEGKRFGQRSIRLSKAYRAIYKVQKAEHIAFIEIIEVNKHEY